MPNQRNQSPVDLGDNGYEREAERIVDGDVQLVVVGMGFTIRGNPDEKHDFDSFQERMRRFARTLRERMGYRVSTMQCHRRKGHEPWAQFEVTTPEFYLPIPNSPAMLRPHDLPGDEPNAN